MTRARRQRSLRQNTQPRSAPRQGPRPLTLRRGLRHGRRPLTPLRCGLRRDDEGPQLSTAAHLEGAYADRDFGGYFDHAAGEAVGRLVDHLKPIGENSVAALGHFELGTLVGGEHIERGRRALESVAQLPARYGLMAAGERRRLVLHRVRFQPGARSSVRHGVVLETAPSFPVLPSVDDTRLVMR